MYLGDDDKCHTDETVVPLYRALCTHRGAAYAACSGQLRHAALEQLCGTLSLSVAPRVLTAHQAHNEMFGVFKEFDESFTAYAERAECARQLYDEQPVAYGQKSHSLYYAYEYSLFELPFAWWFKCTLLSGVDITSATKKVAVVCAAWGEQYDDFPVNAANWLEVMQRANVITNYEADMAANAAAKALFLKEDTISRVGATSPDFFRVCSLRTTFGEATTSLAQWEAFQPLTCVDTGDHTSAACSALESYPNPQIMSGDLSHIEVMAEKRTYYEKVTRSMRDLPYVQLVDRTNTGTRKKEWVPYAFRDKQEYNTEEYDALAKRLYPNDPGCFFNADKEYLYGVRGEIAGPFLFTRSQITAELAYIKDKTGIDYDQWKGRLVSSMLVGKIFCDSYKAVDGCFGDCTRNPYLYLCTPYATYIDAFSYAAPDGYPSSLPEKWRRFWTPPKLPQSSAGNVNDPLKAYRLLVPQMRCRWGAQSWGTDLLQSVGDDNLGMLDVFATFLETLEDTQSPGYGKTYDLPPTVKTWLRDHVTDEPNTCYVDLSEDTSGTLDPLDGLYMRSTGAKVSYVTRTQMKNEMCSNPQCTYLGENGADSSDPVVSLTQADSAVKTKLETVNLLYDYVYWTTSTTPMFTDVAARTSFQFDASENARHEKHLLRDLSGEVLCVEGAVWGYGDCHHNEWMAELRSFVNTAYAEDYFSIAAPGETLDFLGLDMIGGTVVGWAATERSPLVEGLLDEAVCAGAVPLTSVCYGEDARPINPWVGGDFNAFVGCDTTKPSLFEEVIDGLCSAPSCTGLSDFYEHQPGPTCIQNGFPVRGSKRNTDGAANNLCAKGKIDASGGAECAHKQGLLGGGTGVGAGTLYSLGTLECAAKTNAV
eukprot:7095-Rhodomonas_salina.1